ncbi:hypothetical protein IQ13_3145 [Lacibacter cauensis]|uniref:Phospholipase D-like protein n=1 Tax=Lacibacter cauensis TaxID=510947 RepID=A0A562SH37_9BACT|nr:hypothetical protein [Lacibacter cauensis]TWI80468.1 hypothetical protein IQ13_3145 [Lacibacter cauensis]
MSRSKKIFIGILAFLPIISTAVLIIYMLISFLPEMLRLESEYHGNIPPEAFFFNMTGFIISAVVLGLIHLGLMVFFIIHAINNNQVKTEERIIWVLLFIFVNSIAFPIYWGLRIWPKEKTDSNFIRM